MNNKSDKKRKPKPKPKPKHKKKTASRQSKKKSGGGPWYKGLLSGTKPESNQMTQLKQSLLPKQNKQNSTNQEASSASTNQQQVRNSTNQISTGSYNLITKTPSNKNNWKNPNQLSKLQQPLLSESNPINPASRALQAPTNSNNPARISLSNTKPLPPLPPPPPPPNAQPQGFNTIKSTSRCSIL